MLRGYRGTRRCLHPLFLPGPVPLRCILLRFPPDPLNRGLGVLLKRMACRLVEGPPNEAPLQPLGVDVHRFIRYAIRDELPSNVVRRCHARSRGVGATVDDRLGYPLAWLVPCARRFEPDPV